MPPSLHSRSRSGGLSDSRNQRAASAPYCSTITSESTTFFFDLDIFSMRPVSTGVPVAISTNVAPPLGSTSSGESQRPSSER